MLIRLQRHSWRVEGEGKRFREMVTRKNSFYSSTANRPRWLQPARTLSCMGRAALQRHKCVARLGNHITLTYEGVGMVLVIQHR
jgi:hypothetical protein